LRRAVSAILLTVVLFGLAGCLWAPDCFRKEVFCAAIVTDTLGIEDHGPAQDTWAGLEKSKANGMVDQIEYIESVDPRDFEKNISYFGEKGYDLIMTPGMDLSAATIRAAGNYPGSVFIAIDQPAEKKMPNVIPINFPEDQIGFAAGASAASISVTRVVGAVCETSAIDSMWRYCEGFRAGAKFVDEHINVQVTYRENGAAEKLFMDETWGYETAKELIGRGADVIFAAGGVTGQGALRAASAEKVNAIGTERDQRAALGDSPSGVLTSIYGDAGSEVESVIRLVKDGGPMEGRVGPIKFVAIDENFPEKFTQELELLLLSLSNGNVKTNVNVERP
jgi:basic membrane protein A and related proteins